MVDGAEKKEKIIQAVGKRKRSVAIATLRKGSGKIKINGKPIQLIQPKYVRMRIEEGLMLAENVLNQVDIDVNVKGGGIFGQADASRIAICNALSKFNEKLKRVFLDYSRSLLISDPRRTEPHKPSRSSAGPRRKKQQSKR